MPWIEVMEAVLGSDFYFVHFNRQPGVADAVFDENTFRFLRNLYRKNVPPAEPQPGMALINLARAETPLGDPVMSDSELAVFVSAFASSGFTGGVNWYRTFDLSWELTAPWQGAPVTQPALYVYGERDGAAQVPGMDRLIPNLRSLVPNLTDTVALPGTGHWTQQERPDEVNALLLKFLADR